MNDTPNRIVLIGYLNEALPPDQMARVEELLRKSKDWRDALSDLQGDVDQGEHSVATIWRRHRLTCPSREKLGAFLSDAVTPDEADYIRFHLDLVGCRWCQANLGDLREAKQASAGVAKDSARRRSKVYQSSLRMLPESKKRS